MKVGLVGPSYQERSLDLDAQRTVNLYPVLDPLGKETAALYGTPGLSQFATIPNDAQAVRGAFTSANGRSFLVASNSLFEVFSTGTCTLLASMGVNSNAVFTEPVTMDENGFELAICDGQDLWIYSYALQTITKVADADADFPGAATVCFMDGYFVFNDPDTGKFYVTSLYEGNEVDALDFASAESSPDDIVCVKKVLGMLWLFGKRTVEIWANQGGGDFPFSRIEGASMDMGCAGAHTVSVLDNSVFWVGDDVRGGAIVYRANGATPQRISTHAIELILSRLSTLSELRSYSYQQSGHLFYVLTGGGLSTTLVYDATTGQWHERAYLNAAGEYECQLGVTCTYAFGKHLVGDRLSATIYEMSEDYFSDNGNPIKRERIFTHLYNEGMRTRINELQVDFERGVGLTTGQGSEPAVALQISSDLGKTYGDEHTANIGAKGVFRPRVVWRRLGMGSAFTFKITMSDPVKVAIVGAYIR